MAEHRRSMRALERVSSSAARVAETTGARHLQAVPGDVTEPAIVRELVERDENVLSLAAARARRSGHPAGSRISRPSS